MKRRIPPKPITLADVLRIPAGAPGGDPSWVNGIFEAYVHESSTFEAQGNRSSKLTLLDPADGRIQITFTVWGMSNPPAPGTFVTVTGQGIQRREYEGEPQISGKAESVEVRAIGAPSPAQAPQQAELYPPPAPVPPPAPAPSRAPVGPPSGTPRFSGPMVGGAVKIASELIAGIPGRGIDYYDSSDFTVELYRIASHILRVQEVIQGGKIAPKPGERVPMGDHVPPRGQITDIDGNPVEDPRIGQPPAPPPRPAGPPPGAPPSRDNPPPPARADRPQPGPGGSVSIPEEEDDCPF